MSVQICPSSATWCKSSGRGCSCLRRSCVHDDPEYDRINLRSERCESSNRFTYLFEEDNIVSSTFLFFAEVPFFHLFAYVSSVNTYLNATSTKSMTFPNLFALERYVTCRAGKLLIFFWWFLGISELDLQRRVNSSLRSTIEDAWSYSNDVQEYLNEILHESFPSTDRRITDYVMDAAICCGYRDFVLGIRRFFSRDRDVIEFDVGHSLFSIACSTMLIVRWLAYHSMSASISPWYVVLGRIFCVTRSRFWSGRCWMCRCQCASLCWPRCDPLPS